MGISGEVLSFIQRHKLLAPGDRVLVAVSGGPDSVALLHLLSELRGQMDLRLEVAHLQHGIRGTEAQDDARFVAELARALGLPFHLREANIRQIRRETGKGNLEALARAERYRFFAEVVQERELHRVATAHTLDDQAETVLMWFLRGAGMKGLSGMPPAQNLRLDSTHSTETLKIIRPLLEVSKAEILHYLESKKVDYRIDRTNLDTALLRNWIRLKLMPQLKEKAGCNLPSRLAQQAALIREEEEFLQRLAQAELGRIRTAEGIDRGALLKCDKALQRRLLRVWIEAERGHLRGLDFLHVEALLDLVKAGPPQGRLAIPGGWELVKEYEGLRLEKRPRNSSQPCACYSYDLQVGEDLQIDEAELMIQARAISPPLARLPDDFMEAVFDRAFLTPNLTLRNFRHGDRFQPLGMAGHKKVKELFIERKVPLSMRTSLPLLVLGNEVIWIPGYARSEVAKVTSATQSILHLKAVPAGH
ncbi:MAG TPA: tRNA lysidine(34) synthetase TilS [Candidatus Binatia bacterium]|nr:tRNA lysidine(34) synthetase TilS [Candidatus Binatia bacterium]